MSQHLTLGHTVHCTSHDRHMATWQNDLLTSSHREYYMFSGPLCGIIFSENSENISSQ